MSDIRRLTTTRSAVRHACNLLTIATPEALDGCRDTLERAISELKEFQPEGRNLPFDPAAHKMARTLQTEIVRAGRLLETLATFYRGWERILGAMSGGYTANGAPAAVSRLGRLHCRG